VITHAFSTDDVIQLDTDTVPITHNEMRKAITCLKNGKAAVEMVGHVQRMSDDRIAALDTGKKKKPRSATCHLATFVISKDSENKIL